MTAPLKVRFAVHFARGEQNRGYLSHPYWPEMAQLVEIQKQSGMNRAKSAANRRKALEEYLRSAGMTLADYERLEALAKRPFHVDAEGKILIPLHHVESFWVATCDELRAANRPCAPEQTHTRLMCTPWQTEKTGADGKWERFAVVTSGTGQKLSNQRGFRSDVYITDFSAHGSVSFDPEFVDPATLRRAFEWGGQFVGIGASRKMGWGRFSLVSWEIAEK